MKLPLFRMGAKSSDLIIKNGPNPFDGVTIIQQPAPKPDKVDNSDS